MRFVLSKLKLNRFSMRNSTTGFTLIELLVVISIIGLLSSVVLASLNTARQKARDARRIIDLKQLDLAIRLYRENTGGYPVCPPPPATSEYISDSSCLGAILISARLYSKIPLDPLNTGANRYQYWSSASDRFSIRTMFERKPLRFSHTYPAQTEPETCDGVSLIDSTGAKTWSYESVYPNPPSSPPSPPSCDFQWVQHSDYP